MKHGILLVNLGSPDSPAVHDVRRYLAQFLMDARVIDVPWLLRFLIVYLTILPSRPKETAKAYQSIWHPEGFPLIRLTKQVQTLLQAQVEAPVEIAMRYGNPSIQAGLSALLQDLQIGHIRVVPLYPHYAMSSYETVVEEVKRCLKSLRPVEVDFVPPFYSHPDYISALVASAKPVLDEPYDHLLFSYHGLPERHLKKSDPTKSHCLSSTNCCFQPSPAHETCYRHQVYETSRLFVEAAGITDGRWSVSFQSRLGRDPWLQPYTDEVIPKLAKAGVKRLLVMCPAFVSDCLETIEEIGDRGRELFLENGGESFTLIPCLNENPEWISCLKQLVV
ncbi:MAG: ferrochelatase [Candidatus Margulisiibacteriota bacterium]